MNRIVLVDKVATIELPQYDNSLYASDRIIIELSATHTGFVNKNFYWYDTETVKERANTFLHPYPKPLVISHEWENPVTTVGRVIGIEFVSLPKLEKDDLYSPEGVLKVFAEVTDPDAIKRVLDRRFLTVSIGAEGSAYCSICGEKLSGDPFEHEHVRGKKYDGKLAYWIIKGDLEYTQVAFVNTPADSYAKVEKVLSESQYTELIQKSGYNDSVTKGNRIFLFDVYQKGRLDMGDKEKDKDVYMEDFSDLELSEEDINSLKELSDEFLEEVEKTSDEFEIEVDEEELEDSTEEDRKLPPAGSKARKKMKTVFCGPNKTFPIPDCKHAAVALAMLNWPKVKKKYSASVRARIRACVMRRAKALGCKMAKKKKDSVDENTATQETMHKKHITDENAIRDIVKGVYEDTIREHKQRLEKLEQASKELLVRLEKIEEELKNIANMKDEDLVDTISSLTTDNVNLNNKVELLAKKLYTTMSILLGDLEQRDNFKFNDYVEDITAELSLPEVMEKIKNMEEAINEKITSKKETTKQDFEDNEAQTPGAKAVLEFFNMIDGNKTKD